MGGQESLQQLTRQKVETIKGPCQVGRPELPVAAPPRHGFLQPLEWGGEGSGGGSPGAG